MLLFRPIGERLRLDARHVGLVAAEPEQAGRRARLRAHRDGAAVGTVANVQNFQAVIVHRQPSLAPPG